MRIRFGALASAFVLACSPTLAATQTVGAVAAHGAVLIDARSRGYDYTIKLTITGWDKREVSVEQTSPDARGVSATIRRDGATTKIVPVGGTTGKKSFFRLLRRGNSARIAWIVHVPNDLPLSAYAENSNEVVRGVRGPLTLESSNGDVDVDGAGPQIEARTSNGEVRISIATLSGHAPTIVIRTSNGNVSLRVPSGFHTKIDTRTYNGTVKNPFSYSQGPGSASISTANGDITITTGS